MTDTSGGYGSGNAPATADDDDADDMPYPTGDGSADGHADCVPTASDSIWPGTDNGKGGDGMLTPAPSPV